ncbi:MAG: LPXTG cell wall anchor domain-containing protein [Clostridia bacterium]|nr:LPXTG cell wall anchor domain-containing protein [Clostridia bacterium]
MKSSFGKYLFLLLAGLVLILLTVSLTAAAQSGHGGTTQVIAHIRMPSEAQSEEPSPESSTPASSDTEPSGQPAQTGEDSPIFMYIAALASLILILIFGTRKKLPNDRRQNNGKEKKKDSPSAEGCL